MTIDELKAAIERRGFLIRLWLPDEDCVKMIVMMADCSLAWEVTLLDLRLLRVDTTTLIEGSLGSLANNQHIVCCSQCKEPLLMHVNQKLALLYLQGSAKPNIVLEVVNKTKVASIVSRLNAGMPVSSNDVRILPGTNMDEALAEATMYRFAKAGPDSAPIAYCPTCGNSLKDGTEEIIDG
jgi:hypothetical protein